MQDLAGVMRSGVEQHVASLRGSLETATENQASLTQTLANTIEQVSAGAESNARVTGTLEDPHVERIPLPDVNESFQQVFPGTSNRTSGSIFR